MAVQHLAGLRDLVATWYGRTLAGKLFVLVAAVTLVWAAATAPVERRSRWWMREAAVLFGLLALAGLLVSLPPPI